MPDSFEIVRDPLWGNIRLDDAALAVLDTPVFQRLRYVRQMGHAFLVYPGASHSRFEHALGAYHLAGRALAALADQAHWPRLDPDEGRVVRLAALLHDVGHYPFSHALEEAGLLSHEAMGVRKLHATPLGEVLARLGGAGFADRVGAMITGTSASPLGGLVSGSLDLDKIDYLSRDARACGVPYGTVDVDRLLASLALVEGPAGLEVGVHEKGVSALESLLFAKYQMYRNVYWHHASRCATCMFKRSVREAVQLNRLALASIADATDEGLMEQLVAGDPDGLAARLRRRQLHKRALDLPAADVPDGAGDWIADDPDLLELVEDHLARELGLARGELLLDYPSRSSMLGVDIALRLRDGGVDRLTDAGRAGQLGLPRIAGELYRSARRLRVFVGRPVRIDAAKLLALVERGDEEVRRVVAGEERVL